MNLINILLLNFIQNKVRHSKCVYGMCYIFVQVPFDTCLVCMYVYLVGFS